MKKSILLILVSLFFLNSSFAQLQLGSAKSSINFRTGPGVNYKVEYQIDQSDLLVILPGDPQNNFIQVFDIETSSYGYVAERLIEITDTLNFQEQKFFEYAGENTTSQTEIELINGTTKTLFVWVNKINYFLSPYEKKVLILDTEDVMFFSSAEGLFPVFGKEVLKKGNTYRWNFTL